jgi:cytochrome c oxidase subunit 3
MASTAIAEQSNKNLWGGGVSPLKASYGKLMMWFFLLSDAFTFSGLLITYGLLRYSHNAYEGVVAKFQPSQDHWPIPEKIFDAFPFLHGISIPLAFVGLMTFILILSSVTMVLAVEAGHRMDKKGVVKWMLWTLVGGLAFLGCQAWEWSHFIHGTDHGRLGHWSQWRRHAYSSGFLWGKPYHQRVWATLVCGLVLLHHRIPRHTRAQRCGVEFYHLLPGGHGHL